MPGQPGNASRPWRWRRRQTAWLNASAPPLGNPPGGLVINRRPSRSFYGGIAAYSNITPPPAVAGQQPHGFISGRRRGGQFFGGVLAPPLPGPPGTAPDHLVVARRSSARAVWRGFVSTTVNATPGQTVNGTVPDHLVISRRAAARAVWHSQPVPPIQPRVQTGGLVRRRLAGRGLWRGFVSSTTNLLNGDQPGTGLVRRRQSARVVWAGTVSRTVNATAAQPGVGVVPDHLVVARRAAARAVWRGWISSTTNLLNGNQPGRGQVSRRASARAVWRPTGTETTNLLYGNQPGSGLVKRRMAARAVWRPTATETTNLLNGNPPGAGLVRRRSAARAVWYPTRTSTTNAAPQQPGAGVVQPRTTIQVPRRGARRGQWAGWVSRTVNTQPTPAGTAPDHLVIARRQPARGVWAGTTVRTTNQPVADTTVPHLVVARRATARGLWRGGPVGPLVGKPGTGGLVRRRLAGRAVTYWRPVKTVNVVPPAGTAPKHLTVARRGTYRAVVAGTVARTHNAIPGLGIGDVAAGKTATATVGGRPATATASGQVVTATATMKGTPGA